jgi:hypothetical protein
VGIGRWETRGAGPRALDGRGGGGAQRRKERAMTQPNQLIVEVLIPLIVVLPLIVFWLRMFRDMLDNAYLPPGTKDYWTLAFIFASIFTAIYYYVNVYRRPPYRY